MTTGIDLGAGSLFARDFRIERLLGRGGMGAVYLAQQLSTARPRALKVMNPALVRDDDLRRRFVQEARIGSRIESEHVVEVIAAGVDEDTGMPWLAMELLEGEDLEAYVRRQGPLPPGAVNDVMVQLCHALAAAHAVGVVHRDLKPENVFIARTRREGASSIVKLLDLGIAKLVAESKPSDTAAVGTPLWMAPEQTGGKVGPQADVWALGLLAYYMLTGRHYWRASNESTGENVLMTVLREVVIEPLESASERAARYGAAQLVPVGFDAWFARCVNRDLKLRFADAAEARNELSRVLSGSAATLALPSLPAPRASDAPRVQSVAEAETISAALVPTEPTARARRRGPLPRAALAVGGLALLGALGVAVLRGGWPSSTAPASNASAVAPSAPPPVAAASVASSTAVKPEPPVDQNDSHTVWRVPVGDSPQRGPADAVVTVIEFANFQCPFSKRLDATIRGLIDEFQGKVRVVWKDDPLAIHSQAEAASQLAREARATRGDAGFWEAHDLLLDPELKLTEASMLAAAARFGLDKQRAERVLKERPYLEAISRDADLADDFSALGTPNFFVNGRRVLATPTLAELRAVVVEEIAHGEKLAAEGAPKAGLYERMIADGRGSLPLEVRTLGTLSASDPSRGGADAGVILLEMCSYDHYMCRLIDPTIDRLLHTFESKLGVVWMDLPSKKPEAQSAALLARATYKQKGADAFDQLRRLLLGTQLEPGGLSRAAIQASGRKVGLTPDAIQRALADPDLGADVESDIHAAATAGVSEAPAFLVCDTNYCSGGGYFLGGTHPARAFEKRIRLALAAAGGTLPRAAH